MVVAHGDVDPLDAAVARAADLVVAADGGGAHLARWGIDAHVTVGDLDSMVPGTSTGEVERHLVEKDATDTELAVERALAAGADDVVVLGALGGERFDHALANVLLIATERARIRVVQGRTTIVAMRAGERGDLDGRPGDIVTLLAIGGDAEGIVTEGLRYPLRGEGLRFGSSRGVSNEIVALPAAVSVGSGTLLAVTTAAPEPHA